ncbi:SCP2 domain-containing protein [Accumulibacter sp.]|uniref:ubiquinone biosynthesis accessory factor UbiJ n=1 Tax=Accumulibacter sp. TaxID=2053492 RepID=UPI0025CEC87E|nr:SCP2 sterol-binding domain-containing protein [Accumulibacter sp.]MCM8595933.1 hypothetical protein [Accumulibacter sp.]MCM8624542.1 hypothetical protein [Accumulibacter sp.]MDS4050082.1 hypothetical protein [Accumulibacter sp.]
MFARPALAFVNHLLTGEHWARERLAAFAGKLAQLRLGGTITVGLMIGDQGLCELAPDGVDPAVTIELPVDSLAGLMAGDPAALFSSARISGSVDLAEALGFVFRNLRWDVEHDLAQLVGDIVARRAVQLAGSFARWHAESSTRLVESVAEYLEEEARVLARRSEVEQFCGGVDVLRDDLARFEKRLERTARSR